MKRDVAIDMFVALGVRLERFGVDAASRQAIRQAAAENIWFTEGDIHKAVEAIRLHMLDRECLESWLDRYAECEQPLDVAVIAAGNIPLVGFFDLMCVIAAGHNCLFKPSSKDRAMSGYVVGLLKEIEPTVPVSYYSDSVRPAAVIATGSDNTNRYFRSRFRELPSILRSGRGSVAVLDGREDETTLRRLADDIFDYSGLGCRNVSMILIPEEYDTARLHNALSGKRDINPHYTNNYRQRRALLAMGSDRFHDGGFYVATEGRALPSYISEIVINRYSSAEDAGRWLSDHDNEIQCVVSDFYSHPRATAIGSAQTPSLDDYPDGIDVMEFLTNLHSR